MTENTSRQPFDTEYSLHEVISEEMLQIDQLETESEKIERLFKICEDLSEGLNQALPRLSKLLKCDSDDSSSSIFYLLS